ncbi:5-formyltetrahydrofolate cyclo-ligase [Aerococcaceae bacterium WGS1372]
MKEVKKQLRQDMLNLRTSLDTTYVQNSDQAIIENILNSQLYLSSKVIFCFMSMESEVNTRPIIEDALNRGKIVCVPKVISKGKMEAFEIYGFDDFELSSFGIHEPKEGSLLIDPEHIELGIIPNITVSRSGYRLGYGGGFYDRYFLRSDMFRMAVCREQLIQEELPVEQHDQKVDAIVTELGIINI